MFPLIRRGRSSRLMVGRRIGGRCSEGKIGRESKQFQPQMDSRVEERRGVAWAIRFPSPLIKPDVRISRIRLSDWLHDRLTTGRLAVAGVGASAYPDRRTPPPG